jgi:hypothetical protein
MLEDRLLAGADALPPPPENLGNRDDPNDRLVSDDDIPF